MKTSFWIEEKSPQQFFETIIQRGNRKATLWDVFRNYAPMYNHLKHVDLLGMSRAGVEMIADDFIYPQIVLSYSDTFYGSQDAGNLTYEEQHAAVSRTFKNYKREITELLGQQPDKSLHPKPLRPESLKDQTHWDMYDTLFMQIPFLHEFEGQYTVWKGDRKVLFLSVRKEDNELPYDVVLGGLELDKYQEVLTVYNGLVDSFR
ncbi:hypothetical protein POV27_11980 [Aureisphaera galaxeae]|uniref:hypothetical protein n=1 Tax=Aureisphaera galaxeae TaxID=1538023 RepID=UPI0023506889|nr:hypothetical protein [Aureisphaera galaxeae]MDC8004773.1 hypothetical protein [Aureisphaera galaxeae]